MVEAKFTSRTRFLVWKHIRQIDAYRPKHDINITSGSSGCRQESTMDYSYALRILEVGAGKDWKRKQKDEGQGRESKFHKTDFESTRLTLENANFLTGSCLPISLDAEDDFAELGAGF